MESKNAVKSCRHIQLLREVMGGDGRAFLASSGDSGFGDSGLSEGVKMLRMEVGETLLPESLQPLLGIHLTFISFACALGVP